MQQVKQAGYTLIELLLYIAILGSLLLSVSLYFAITAEARLKNQSITEVNQQGALAMETITQTIRNADTITSPTLGTSGASLTVTVPTPALSPTIFNSSGGGGSTLLGYSVDGTATDSANSNNINACKFVASASGTITTLYARIGATVGTNPNNKGQMAIYSGATPTTLLASSSATTLTANAVNAFSISSVAVTSGQTYWLSYNANGTAIGQNDLRYHTGTTGQSRFVSQTYGTWPASWSGTSQNLEFSMYAMIDAPASPGAFQIKEGTGAVLPFTNDKVEMTNLTFRNLSRASTPGVVQVSFTLSRINTANKNEYEYQKTFTTTASLRH